MSKTTQQKISAYQQGVDDALSGNPIRWAHHPKLKQYMHGYKMGKSSLIPLKPKGLNFFERLLFVLFNS